MLIVRPPTLTYTLILQPTALPVFLVSGKQFTAADIWWAPFLERFAAILPLLYATLAPRPAKGAGSFEALSEW